MSVARLVVPAIRWDADTGFAAAMPAARADLAAGVGGFIIFGGTAETVRELTAELRTLAGRPLLLAADLERGAGQQFAGLSDLPPPLALAALDDPEAIRTAGRLTANEAVSVGINWVFAPVADLDLEPDNPIVQTRSFGAEAPAVSAAVRFWIAGCQEAGVLACAKHYPGHGRTTADSHSGIPVVPAAESLLRAHDLAPFRAAISAGVAALMTAHVAFPALDPSGAPATFSRVILGDLRSRLGFTGLVVSDALVMAGALQGRTPASAAVEAIQAGVDVLLYPSEPLRVIEHLRAEVATTPGLAARVAQSVERMDHALDRVGIPPVEPPRVGLAEATRLRHRLLAQGVIRGAAPVLREPLHVEVIDDDLDGHFPPTPSDRVVARLGALGVAMGEGGSRVVLVLAEPRAGKGRGGVGERVLAALASSGPAAELLVLFGHPRLAEHLPGPAPILLAWHRQGAMQDAVGDWLAARIGQRRQAPAVER